MQAWQTSLQALASSYQVADFPEHDWLRYAELVDETNRQTNLIGTSDPHEFIEILFGDALQLLKSGWLQGTLRIVDVGSGAGAPTIPLALVLRPLLITLIEARRRRVAFLRRVIGELSLQDRVQVLEQSVDPERAQVLDAEYDIALSRATWPVEQWLHIGATLAPRLIAFASKTSEYVANPPWHLQAKIEYVLPIHRSERALLLFER